MSIHQTKNLVSDIHMACSIVIGNYVTVIKLIEYQHVCNQLFNYFNTFNIFIQLNH